MSKTLPRQQQAQPAESEIDVAVLYPGNRIEKMAVPLQATEMEVRVEPDGAYDSDVVVLDNADRDLGKEVLRNPLHDAELVYRMRGDVYRELERWDMHPIKKWVAINLVLRNLDGAIAVNDMLAEKIRRVSGVKPVGSAGLWKHVEDWPTVGHSGTALDIITLTNANYWLKVEPILEYADVVEEWLHEHGGHWYVCGEGQEAERLADGLSDYYHITYEGFVDAKKWIRDMDLMFHPSNLDGQPNSILEGMASGLPVVTNDFEAFQRFAGPVYLVDGPDTLEIAFEQLQSATERARWGQQGIKYVEEHHTPEAIGQQYVDYFQRLLSQP